MPIINGSKAGLRAQLLRGATGGLLLKLANTVLTMGTSVLLARLLGAEGYGIYSFAMALVLVLTVPSQFGLPVTLVRYVATYQVQQQWALLRGLLQRANQVVLMLSLVTMVVSGVVAWLLGSHFNQDALNTFMWALASLPLLALGALRGATLRGLHRVVLGQMPELLIRPACFVILLGIMAYVSPHYNIATPPVAMVMNFSATGVGFLLGAWWLLRYLPELVKKSTPVYETRAWMQSALPIFLIGGMQIINTQINLIMLGMLRTADEVGIYRAAVNGASLVSFTLVSINTVLAPNISRFYTQGELVKMQKMVTISTWVTFLTSLPVALLLILYGRILLGTLFGTEFTQAYLALTILCIGQLVNAGMGPVGILLTMTGHEKYTARGRAVATGFNIILNAILIPVWGIEGAAVASSTGLIVWNVLLAIWVKQKLHLSITAFGSLKR